MEELLKILKSGYPVHPSWAGQAADTIERLQKAFDDDQEVLKGLEQERDAALAEVERLTKERVIFTARSVIVTEDEAREMFPDPDAEAKPPASD